MAEWWLLDEPTQRRIAAHVDEAANRVLQHFDAHHDEDSITAALFQELVREPILSEDITVTFRYRNFPGQSEEPLVGADGGIVVRIETRGERIEKGELFQAKRFPQENNPRSLSIPREDDAGLLKRQVEAMLKITDESIVISYTRRRIYVVEAPSLADLTDIEIRHPFRRARLLR